MFESISRVTGAGRETIQRHILNRGYLSLITQAHKSGEEYIESRLKYLRRKYTTEDEPAITEEDLYDLTRRGGRTALGGTHIQSPSQISDLPDHISPPDNPIAPHIDDDQIFLVL